MTENVDNIVLEQLRLIRSEIGDVQGQLTSMTSKIDDLQVGQQALQGMIFGLSAYMRGIDERVEHIETKLGIET